jgi:hypothetical protein
MNHYAMVILPLLIVTLSSCSSGSSEQDPIGSKQDPIGSEQDPIGSVTVEMPSGALYTIINEIPVSFSTNTYDQNTISSISSKSDMDYLLNLYPDPPEVEWSDSFTFYAVYIYRPDTGTFYRPSNPIDNSDALPPEYIRFDQYDSDGDAHLPVIENDLFLIQGSPVNSNG